MSLNLAHRKKYFLHLLIPGFIYKIIKKIRFPLDNTEFTKLLLAKYALKNGGSAIDIGAHQGFYSYYYAEILKNTSGKVYSFEPNPYVFFLLKKARYFSKEKHFLFRQAISHQSHQTVSFSVRPFSLSRDSSIGGVNGFEKWFYQKINVQTLTLDDFIKSITDCSLIKIDAERHEPFIIEGGKNFILKNKPFIIFEYACEDKKPYPATMTLLDKLGYFFFDIETLKEIKHFTDYYSALTDIFAVPKEKKEEAKNLFHYITTIGSPANV